MLLGWTLFVYKMKIRRVIPILDAKGIQHRTHLAAETMDAPASALAQIIFDIVEREKADLVVLGANEKPVGISDALLGAQPIALQIFLVAFAQEGWQIRALSLVSDLVQ